MAGLAAGDMRVERTSDELLGKLKAISAMMAAEWLDLVGNADPAIIDAYSAAP